MPEHPLTASGPHRVAAPRPVPDDVTLRVPTVGDPSLPAALAPRRLAFAEKGTSVGSAGRSVGSAGREELSATTGEPAENGTVTTVRPGIPAGHGTPVAALAADGTPLTAGQYHLVDGSAGTGGADTLPAARRRARPQPSPPHWPPPAATGRAPSSSSVRRTPPRASMFVRGSGPSAASSWSPGDPCGTGSVSSGQGNASRARE